jgi:hypothetical protein
MKPYGWPVLVMMKIAGVGRKILVVNNEDDYENINIGSLHGMFLCAINSPGPIAPQFM